MEQSGSRLVQVTTDTCENVDVWAVWKQFDAVGNRVVAHHD